MFYVCECVEVGKKYGVMDTKDGVVEYYTPEKLINICLSRDIRIEGVSVDNELSVDVVKGDALEFLEFKQDVSAHVEDRLQIWTTGWQTLFGKLDTEKHRISKSICLLVGINTFSFLCEIDDKVYLYDSFLDDFFDISMEVKSLSEVDTLWISGIPLSKPEVKNQVNFKILSGDNQLHMELTSGWIKFMNNKKGVIYKVVR